MKTAEIEIEYRLRPDEDDNGEGVYDIVYNGVIYGEWNNNGNVDFPEDLCIGRDLNDLVDTGVKIGVAAMHQFRNDLILDVLPILEEVTNRLDWHDDMDIDNELITRAKDRIITLRKLLKTEKQEK